MKEIKVIECKRSTYVETIENFANSIGIKLPRDYISFLLKHNGGYPIKDAVDLIEPVWNDLERGKTVGIAWFCALCEGYDNDLRLCYRIFKNRIPKGFIPIIDALGGNLICICVEDKNYGKVYYWDHNWEAGEKEEVTYDNVYLVANSFTDFINSLYESDLEEDENNKRVLVSNHDKYSLLKSRYIKKYGKVLAKFFDRAPKEVEEFIIKEFTANGDLLLLFKSKGKEYSRRLNKEGKILK